MTPKPFALSVSALILDEHQQCLMLRRSASSKHYAGTWEPPGGKCDSGEAMEAALLREVEEETGLQVRAHAPPGLIPVEMTERQIAYLFFEARVTSGELTNKGDVLKCFGKMPSLLKADLPGSCNLPEH